jgi:hypothetical protein
MPGQLRLTESGSPAQIAARLTGSCILVQRPCSDKPSQQADAIAARFRLSLILGWHPFPRRTAG